MIQQVEICLGACIVYAGFINSNPGDMLLKFYSWGIFFLQLPLTLPGATCLTL